MRSKSGGNGPDVRAAVAFSRQAWEDYRFWIQHDQMVARRITRLIDACLREPVSGIGKPEPLKHDLSGYWSRRITKEPRLVYRVVDGRCLVVQCRYHY